MIITFEQLLKEKSWLHSELLHSLTGELINKAREDQYYDVKLVVNGVEVEPKLFNDIVNNIESYVDKQAESLLEEKMEEIRNKSQQLEELVDEATRNIMDKFILEKLA